MPCTTKKKLTRTSRRFIARMSGPKYKKARMLRKEGYSYEQIGKALKISAGTAWRYVNHPQTISEGRDRKFEYKLNKMKRKSSAKKKK